MSIRRYEKWEMDVHRRRLFILDRLEALSRRRIPQTPTRNKASANTLGMTTPSSRPLPLPLSRRYRSSLGLTSTHHNSP